MPPTNGPERTRRSERLILLHVRSAMAERLISFPRHGAAADAGELLTGAMTAPISMSRGVLERGRFRGFEIRTNTRPIEQLCRGGEGQRRTCHDLSG